MNKFITENYSFTITVIDHAGDGKRLHCPTVTRLETTISANTAALCQLTVAAGSVPKL